MTLVFYILWMAGVFGVLGIFAIWPRAGGIAYLAVILLAPVAIIDHTTLRVETALTPLMLGWLVLAGSFRWRMPLIAFFCWIVWVTLVSVCSHGDTNLVGLFGYGRFVAVALIFGSIRWHKGDLIRTQYVFALSAIPIGLLSAGQVVNAPGVRAITQAAYTYSSQAVFDMQMEAQYQGYVFRGIGVFGNVSPAATYFLVAMIVAIILLCDEPQIKTPIRRWSLLTSLAAAIVGGASTLSATFLVGFTPAIAAAVFLAPPGRRLRSVAIAGLLCLLGTGMVWYLSTTSDNFAAQLDYQWYRIAQGDILEGRYSHQNGVTAEAIEAVRKRPVCGIGVKITDMFYGDSMYVCLLFIGGVVGLLLFFVGFGGLTLVALRSGTDGRLALAWIVLMLLAGIGANGMFILRLGDWWWATQGMLAACYLPPVMAINGRLTRPGRSRYRPFAATPCGPCINERHQLTRSSTRYANNTLRPYA
jgi:hypothetical protein